MEVVNLLYSINLSRPLSRPLYYLLGIVESGSLREVTDLYYGWYISIMSG